MKKCNVLLILALVFAFVQPINAQELVEASFKGLLNKSQKVDFITRAIPNREGSFLGLLKEGYDKYTFFLIDPITRASYSVVEMGILENGHFGPLTTQPQYVLQMTGQGHDLPSFSISSLANHDRNSAHKISMIFKGKESSYQWIDWMAGNYKSGQTDNALYLSYSDVSGFEANALFSDSKIKGNYVLREVISGISLVYKNSITAYGSEVEAIPDGVAFFIRTERFILRDLEKMILIGNRSAMRGTTIFTLK